MAHELQPLERGRVTYYSGNIGIGQTMAAAIGAAGATQTLNLHGQRRVIGNFHAAGGASAAAGYPRVIESTNNAFTSTDIVSVIALDPTQADNQYPFDLQTSLPYVRIEYTNGAVAGTLRVSADTRPE